MGASAWRLIRCLWALIFSLGLASSPRAANALAPPAFSADKMAWRPDAEAQLKLEGRPVKNWNIFRPEKKSQKQLILVQLGHRYLILDTKEHLVYELKPEEVKSEGKGLTTPAGLRSQTRVPGTEWTERDIGPAELIRVKLGDYGQTLELQLPHPVDLRGLY